MSQCQASSSAVISKQHRFACWLVMMSIPLLGVLFAGCTRQPRGKVCLPTSERELRQRVHTGMTERQVVLALGQPTFRDEVGSNVVALAYYLPKSMVVRSGQFNFAGFKLFMESNRVGKFAPIYMTSRHTPPMAPIAQ